MTDLLSLNSLLNLKTPRVAFYGRTSNQDLQDPSLSIPRQVSQVNEAAARMDGAIVRYYWDIETGFKALAARGNGAEASAFNVGVARDGGIHELLADASNNAFDVVLVESIDRISRLTADSTRIEAELAEIGVALMASDEPQKFDANLILTRRVKQALGEFYVHELKQKSWAGMSESAKQGWHAGGRAPYGYQLEEHAHPNPNKARDGKRKHRLVIDPIRAPVVKQIFQWYCNESKGLGEICQLLNANVDLYPAPRPSNRCVGDLDPTWSRATIQAILRNPKYTGLNVWNRHNKRRGRKTIKPTQEWILSDATTHDAIVSPALFERVPLVAAANDNRSRSRGARANLGRQGGRSTSRTYPLRGRVFCAICGRRLSGTHQKGNNWYRCQFIDGRSPAAATTTGHPRSLQVKEAPLLDAVIDFLGRRVFRSEAIELLAEDLNRSEADTTDGSDQEIEELLTRRSNLERQIERLWIEIKRTDDPDDPIANRAREELRSLDRERQGLETRITEIERQATSSMPADAVIAAVAALPDLSAALRSYTPDELAELFDVFDIAVRYEKNQHAAEISAALIPELLTAFGNADSESIRPAEATGQSSLSIAGAGFEPATSGL